MKFRDYLIEKKEDWTGLFIGRMQGLTIGHATLIKLMGKNHPKSYICLVKGKESSKDKKQNPFSAEIQKEMIDKVKPNNVEVKIVNVGFVPDIINELPEDKFVLYSGPDRVAGYRNQIKYLDNKKLKVLDTESILPRKEGISGTKLRNALKDDDKSAFEKIAPKEIHGMFNKLKDLIGDNNEI